MSNGFGEGLKDNVVFATEILMIISAFTIVAYMAEKRIKKEKRKTGRILSTQKMVITGILSAIASMFYILEFPVFFLPGFYMLDFSELPALVGAFALGPVAGVMIEICKIILKLIIKGTSTAFVGELANFAIGCSFILPASVIHMFGRTKQSAIAACMVGTICMTVFGAVFNVIYLLPAFEKLYGMPMAVIVEMGTAVNTFIVDVKTLVLFAVVPMNVLKGASVSVIMILIYKKLNTILK